MGLALAGACAREGPTGFVANAVIVAGEGSFALRSIDAKALPAGIVSDTWTTAGTITLLADGSYARSQRDSTRLPSPYSWQVVEWYDRGHWSTEAASVLLASDVTVVRFPAGTGTFTSDGVQLTFGGHLYDYRRR